MRVNHVNLPRVAAEGSSKGRAFGRRNGTGIALPLEAAELTADDLSLPLRGMREYDDSQSAEIFWSML